MIFKKNFQRIKTTLSAYELSYLKNRAAHHGYFLQIQQNIKDSEVVIENFFKTNHDRNALLSYIVFPFIRAIENNHSNNRECYTIAQILDELGYNVDVINWNNDTFIPAKKYDLVIDNHNNLARLKDHFKQNTRKIFHATNAHWLYQNSVEYARYEAFFKKTGKAIKPQRILPPGNSAAFCDVISMFGNDFTKSTYGPFAHKVHRLPMSVTATPEMISAQNITAAKKKFVWLNSRGGLLKGLDVVMDAFEQLPECTLYVCGNLDAEPELKQALQPQLDRSPNLQFVGWVDMDDTRFKEIANQSAWVINTSFSEGGGGSTLNCMAKGLIPLISQSSSITLPALTGFYLENNTAAELIELVKKVTELTDEELKERSYNSFHFIKSNHTLENFKNKYKDFLLAVL